MAKNSNCSRNTYFDKLGYFGVEIEIFSQYTWYTISESKQFANRTNN